MEIFKGYWTVEDVKNNRHKLFLFGDNDIKRGKGGQAIIRGESNTFGIPTKKFPRNSKDAFYTDNEYEENIFKIDKSFEELNKIIDSKKYSIIVIPENGFGTGLANLKEFAHKTLEYINYKVNQLKEKLSE